MASRRGKREPTWKDGDVAAASELMAEAKELVGESAAQLIVPAARRKFFRPTVRGILGRMRNVARAMDEGNLSSDDAARRMTVYKEFLGAAAGVAAAEAAGMDLDAVLPGYDEEDYQPPKEHVRKKVAVKRGITREGIPVDETTVTVEGGQRALSGPTEGETELEAILGPEED